MGFMNSEARKNNKYNGSELYDAYLDDEENGIRHSLTRMTEYSSNYFLCLTPKYKKVKRFTCDNCCYKDKRDSERACPDYFQVKFIEQYNIALMRKQNMGCVRGRPWNDYYEVLGHLFSEIFKIKEGEYWIRYNKEAHKLWQDVYVSDGDRSFGVNRTSRIGCR
ncbi:hypothetical protein LCGC14_1049990 [marine sediment metagenome]|uniref:Uncharacterized protein n=1 Tax=marine sediment metagenome TaxID=412755 RepID=A0A0F9QV37_9ZZZZ